MIPIARPSATPASPSGGRLGAGACSEWDRAPATLFIGSQAHAAIWSESGDAGSLVSTAQVTAGTGALNQTPSPSSPLPPGLYDVAISFHGHDPQSAGGAMGLPGPPSWRAPDGPGAGGSLTGWVGTPSVQPPDPYPLFFNPDFFKFLDAATPAQQPTWGTLELRDGFQVRHRVVGRLASSMGIQARFR